MDKLDSVGESSLYKSLRKKSKKKESLKTTGFSSLLNSAAETGDADASFQDEESGDGQLEELLDAISEHGEALIAVPTLDNVKRYREGVKHFLKYLVSHVLDVKEEISGTNIMKRKKYTLITIVDKKLEELSRDFLSAQQRQIDLLSRVNEINGLIVDLLR